MQINLATKFVYILAICAQTSEQKQKVFTEDRNLNNKIHLVQRSGFGRRRD